MLDGTMLDLPLSRRKQSGLFLAAAGVLCCALASPSPRLSVPDSSFTEVNNILAAHCTPCHFGSKASAGLDFSSYASLMKGGDSGVAIKPGDQDSSLLVQRILGQGGLPQMPIGFKPLSSEDVTAIKTWISAGARSESKTPTQVHWAYRVPTRPAIPHVKNANWIRNPIDAFILEKLDDVGLRPSPSADKVTLIRRLTLDLIGLPPTSAEVDAYLADKSPNAYEKVVDRLLANPHYGERMALPWLDAARYADSNGFQQDGDTYQYVWRDWVVKALNDNMPFSEFTIDQLAGDLLPHPTLDQRVATAFNRNHMLNGEGGAIPEEQRSVNLFDRVDTTATAWLGLTMTCSRCHDHKYDPLTQRDYYSMMAFFNNVPETGVPSGSGQYRIADPWIYAGTAEQMAQKAEFEKQIEAFEVRIDELSRSRKFGAWRQELLSDLESARNAKVNFSAWSEVGRFVGTSFDNAFDTVFGPETSRTVGVEHLEWKDGQVNPINGDNTAVYLQRTIESGQACTYLFSVGSDDGVKAWLNGKEILNHKVTRAAVADSELIKVSIPPGKSRLLLKIVNGGGIGGFYFRPYPGGVKDDIAALIQSPDFAEHQKLRTFFANELPETKQLGDLRGQLGALNATLPRVMVMSDAKPRKTYIFSRGNYLDHLDQVQPALPKSLSSAMPEPRNRLGLAKWIVSSTNPLTARFFVNRTWQLFFGRGLVRTEENFGVKGEPPIHPKLLDWLAVDFMENGWNVKRLQKLIVMSNTYRQTSKITPELLERDPGNTLYARGSRFRLSSPVLRDVALSSSGLLDSRIGGRPVYPYQPKDIWDGLSITLERDFTYPQSIGSDNHRRSLYTFWRRTVAPGNMFDSANRQVCTVRQTLTSSPLHALTMLNDITWVEAARALAEAAKGSTNDERLSEIFRRICARRPTTAELQILNRSLSRAKESFRIHPEAVGQFLNAGNGVHDVQMAAYASVCLAIYNLDEAMTRE